MALLHLSPAGVAGDLSVGMGRERRGRYAGLSRLTCGAIRCAIAPYVDYMDCTGHDVIKNANAMILQSSRFYYRPNDAYKYIIWAVEL